MAMSQMGNIVKALNKIKETEKEEKPKMELVYGWFHFCYNE